VKNIGTQIARQSALAAATIADEAKAKGNTAFAAGHFEEAIQHLSHAVVLTPDNDVLYSSRSAA
jgi:stress-induced-phosphoprotein 1